MSTTKTSLQLVFDLFNRSNPTLPTPLSATNVSLTSPIANTSGITTRNTAITINAIAGHGYTGSTTAYYDRVSLADVVGAGSTQFPLGSQVSSSDLLAAFNAAFGTNLDTTDIVVENLPAPDGTGKITYNLTANPTSMAFISQVTLTLVPVVLDLATAVTVTDMAGLTVANVTGS